MTLNFYRFLLFVFLLAILSNCGTTRPTPTSKPPADQIPSPRTETPERDPRDRVYESEQELSAHGLSDVVALIRDMPGYQPDIALRILRILEAVPSSQLITMIDSRQLDPELRVWLDLAFETRTTLINSGSVAIAAREWAKRYEGHAINQAEFFKLISRYSALFTAPSQVAILLPTHGGLATAAMAIRDGIISAYLENPGRSIIRFYSSGENGKAAISAYLQAREDGATQIIGPLRVESTRALGNLGDMGIPVLLLNEYANNRTHPPGHASILNSLSLSQTDEAAAIATKALAQGHKKALVIVPNNAWGMRIETAFSTTFEEGEGTISATTHFSTNSSDHSSVLTRLLKIDQSRQRKEDLQFRLGIPLTFEPSRRGDFDMIFLAANPEQGRELKPLLRFHDVGDIPVYAMGRIFRGESDPASDQDLNGIVFPVTPWQLKVTGDSIPKLDSIRGGIYGNLFALGKDAWNLLPWLGLMQRDPDLWFPGDTGILNLNADGNFYRQPTWAQFSAGRPTLHQWPGNH